MYYYAVIDVNYIVTEIYPSDVEVDESNFIPIESEDYDLVGMWYDIEDQTFKLEGNKYLAKLKMVDGAGSGLDADKLDGKEASQFALVNHSHTGYAAETHNHDADYADIDHTHDYAPSTHTHTEYASVAHAHDAYAPVTHNHDSAYATATHTHSQYADDSNVVHKTGEEYVAGTKIHQANLFVNKTNANVIMKVTNLTKGTKATAASYDGVAVQDKDNNVLANMRYAQETDGNGYIQLKCFDYTGDASDYADLRVIKPVGSQGYVQLPNLVKLRNGLQAIYSNGTNFQLGSASLDMLLNAKDDIIFQQRATTKGIIPNANNNHSIGTSSARYASLYLVNTPNVSSDRRLKENIEDVDADDMLDFIDRLNVVEYNYKDDPDVERIGLIAQDVEEAGGDKFIEVGEDGMYGLKTADLVYPLVGAIQALYTRVIELENKMKE